MCVCVCVFQGSNQPGAELLGVVAVGEDERGGGDGAEEAEDEGVLQQRHHEHEHVERCKKQWGRNAGG